MNFHKLRKQQHNCLSIAQQMTSADVDPTEFVVITGSKTNFMRQSTKLNGAKCFDLQVVASFASFQSFVC
jgi:hypothetical protein